MGALKKKERKEEDTSYFAESDWHDWLQNDRTESTKVVKKKNNQFRSEQIILSQLTFLQKTQQMYRVTNEKKSFTPYFF